MASYACAASAIIAVAIHAAGIYFVMHEVQLRHSYRLHGP